MNLLRRLALSRPVALVAQWHERAVAAELRQLETVPVDDADLSRFAGPWSDEEREARVRMWAAQHENTDFL